MIPIPNILPGSQFKVWKFQPETADVIEIIATIQAKNKEKI